MANEKIKRYAAGKGVRLWQLAEAINMQDSNFSRKLRHELNEDETQRILRRIDEIAASQGVKA